MSDHFSFHPCKGCSSTGSKPLRRRVVKGGSVQYVFQCLECGLGSSAIAKAKALGLTGGGEPPEFDSSIRPDYKKSAREELKEERQKNRAEFFAWYSKYLETPQWREIRRKVMLRAQGICEGCRDCGATQVHHLTYDNVGQEFLWELVAVCDECHERYHKAKDARFGFSEDE